MTNVEALRMALDLVEAELAKLHEHKRARVALMQALADAEVEASGDAEWVSATEAGRQLGLNKDNARKRYRKWAAQGYARKVGTRWKVLRVHIPDLN